MKSSGNHSAEIAPDLGLDTKRIISCVGLANVSFLFLTFLALGQERTTIVPVGPSPEHPVMALHFPDKEYGWVTTWKRGEPYLFRTVNGGDTWERIVLPDRFNELFFLDSKTGWALKWHQKNFTLFRTTDGGQTWKAIALIGNRRREKLDIDDFAFVNADIGLFVGEGDSGVGLRTRNGGKSFRRFRLRSRYEELDGLSKVVSDGRGHIWVLGRDMVFRSDDVGQTWMRQLNFMDGEENRDVIDLYSGWAFPDGRVIAVGSDGTTGLVFLSSDLGQHWQNTLRTKATVGFIDVSFANDSFGCAVGFSTKLFCTSDGGKTWEIRDVLPKAKLLKDKPNYVYTYVFYDIVLLPSGRGWVVTGGGYLFQTDDWGETWKEVDLVKLTGKLP